MWVSTSSLVEQGSLYHCNDHDVKTTAPYVSEGTHLVAVPATVPFFSTVNRATMSQIVPGLQWWCILHRIQDKIRSNTLPIIMEYHYHILIENYIISISYLLDESQPPLLGLTFSLQQC